jgi:regulator of sigma E protease
MALAAFIFVIGVLITIHEAGHFVMARLLGAPVEVFSIGFGKRLWGFERGGTDYRVSLIPLGGYVRIIGLGPDESDVVGDGAAETELLPRWKRTLILLAGPLTNIVAAVGFVALAFIIGVEVQAYLDDPPVVGWVEPGSGAEIAGIREGDLVRAVQGKRSASWRDLEVALLTAGGGEVGLTVDRDGEVSEVPVTLGVDHLYGFGVSGIKPHLDSIVQPRAGGPAAGAGLRRGDRIVAINGQPVNQYYELPLLIEPHPGTEITLEVVRNGERLNFELTTMNEAGKGKIGVIPLFHRSPVDPQGVDPTGLGAGGHRSNIRRGRAQRCRGPDHVDGDHLAPVGHLQSAADPDPRRRPSDRHRGRDRDPQGSSTQGQGTHPRGRLLSLDPVDGGRALQRHRQDPPRQRPPVHLSRMS